MTELPVAGSVCPAPIEQKWDARLMAGIRDQISDIRYQISDRLHGRDRHSGTAIVWRRAADGGLRFWYL